MKTREFDIKNYNVDNIVSNIVRKDIENKLKTITHKFIKNDIPRSVAYYSLYSSDIVKFDSLTKTEKKEVIDIAKAQYKEKKAKSIQDYKDIRKQCDEIFYDDNMYKKLIPELEGLFYCQAYTALKDFKDKKLTSRAISNSKFQARAMSYSKIACD